MDPTPRWPIAIALAVVAVYATALTASFQFDDWNVVVGDPRVQSLANWWTSMPGIRPLLKLSYALNWQLDRLLGLGAAGFRAVNVALHAGNTLLLYRVLRELRLGLAAGLSGTAAQWPVVAAVVAFALHPVQTESVTYVSGRSNVLMASFALLAIRAWQRAAAPGISRGTQGGWNLASACAFLLACAVKESAAVLAVALWLLYACAGRAATRPWPATGALLVVLAGMAALPVYRALFEFSLELRGALDNLLRVQPTAILYLLGQLWNVGRLNADPLVAAPDSWDAVAAIKLAAVGALFAIGVASIRRRPALAFGLLWFFTWLAPTNSLLPRIDVVNDRQLYLAIVGPAWLLGLGLAGLLGPRRGTVWHMATVGVVAVVLAGATLDRNRVYATEVSFWQDVTDKSPANGRAYNNLGIALARNCDNQRALAAFRRALVLDPRDYVAASNIELLKLGELAPPGAACPTGDARR